MTGRFDKFTERARKTLQLAQEEAQRFNHNYIGTEHILLGLLRVDDGVAGRVLHSLGIEVNKVRSSVEFIIGRGDRKVVGEIGLTPRSKRVIEYAVDEARRLNHHYIGTEHLLLGLLRDDEAIAAGVLASLGVSLEKVRAATMEVVKASQSDAGQPAGQSPSSPEGSLFPSYRLSLTILRTLYDHSIWARDQLLPLIKSLEQEQLTASEHKGVYGSIHDTLAHMAASEWMWLQRCQGESPMRIPKGEDFKDLLALVVWWNEIHARAVQYLNSISEDHLDTHVTYVGPDGKQRTRQVWHMLLQVPNHQTEHRAQIATMLGSMGLEVPQTDLVVFFSERG